MTKIASSAFANCKKLTKLVVNGKLSSVAKNAFKKIFMYWTVILYDVGILVI